MRGRNVEPTSTLPLAGETETRFSGTNSTVTETVAVFELPALSVAVTFRMWAPAETWDKSSAWLNAPEAGLKDTVFTLPPSKAYFKAISAEPVGLAVP